MKTVSVVVVRAFFYQGAVLPVGSSVELPRVFAMEMVAADKVRVGPAGPGSQSPAPSLQAAAEPDAPLVAVKRGKRVR